MSKVESNAVLSQPIADLPIGSLNKLFEAARLLLQVRARREVRNNGDGVRASEPARDFEQIASLLSSSSSTLPRVGDVYLDTDSGEASILVAKANNVGVGWFGDDDFRIMNLGGGVIRPATVSERREALSAIQQSRPALDACEQKISTGDFATNEDEPRLLRVLAIVADVIIGEVATTDDAQVVMVKAAQVQRARVSSMASAAVELLNSSEMKL